MKMKELLKDRKGEDKNIVITVLSVGIMAILMILIINALHLQAGDCSMIVDTATNSTILQF